MDSDMVNTQNINLQYLSCHCKKYILKALKTDPRSESYD